MAGTEVLRLVFGQAFFQWAVVMCLREAVGQLLTVQAEQHSPSNKVIDRGEVPFDAAAAGIAMYIVAGAAATAGT